MQDDPNQPQAETPAETSTPPPTQVAEATVETVKNTPGTLVLQWLTYAFWGWTVLALTWLTALSVSYFVNKSDYDGDDGSGVAYSLAAVIVLFIISTVCDFLYSRREPLHKQGASMVIMIIHAVIFALCGIGAVIAAVFAVVNMLIGTESSYEGPMTVLITSLIIAIVYGATLLRTVRPFKLKRVTLIYGSFMAFVVVVITALGIIGPVVFAAQTRDDRLIERGLVEVSNAIRDHASKADALPKTLSEVRDQASGDAKTLIDRNMVEYTPGERLTITRPTYPEQSTDLGFEYQLCVTYKAKKGEGQGYTMEYRSGRDVTPNTYRHDAGRVCYDLTTSY